ncbi:11783_t:CDS:2 [Scutellospora calospora]|uniref:11783_t:CDS:1 n=1 Tax=Scutellospora calospora TaxID=85575 RepID=A0ACA9K079_9GLOM|nr:11783_t:CDS:2 [Scutellospora calospora]
MNNPRSPKINNTTNVVVVDHEINNTTNVVVVDHEINKSQNSTNVVVVDHEKSEDYCTSLWSNVREPQGWSSLAYFIFISPIFSLFCAVWVWLTFAISIPTLIFPPFGFFWCIWTAWSWRALGRVEILTTRMCINHDDINKEDKLPQILRVSNEKVGRIKFAVLLCSDKYTWLCFIYFAIVKPLMMGIFFVSTCLLIGCAFPPFTLLGLPFMCIGCKRMGELQFNITRTLLIVK